MNIFFVLQPLHGRGGASLSVLRLPVQAATAVTRDDQSTVGASGLNLNIMTAQSRQRPGQLPVTRGDQSTVGASGFKLNLNIMTALSRQRPGQWQSGPWKAPGRTACWPLVTGPGPGPTLPDRAL